MRDLIKAITARADALRKAAALIAIAALALSLVSILLLAPYAEAALDDFVYGTPVHFALQAGGGFFAVARAVWDNIRYTYMDWQGTFSSVVLFSLEPGAFSESAYGLTAYVFLAAIIAPVFLALGAVRGPDRWDRLFLGGVIAFFSVQYLPSPAQGYYWWNGASHYLAFWFLSVLTVVCQIKLARKAPTGPRFYMAAGGVCLLGFLVGGGNFCTALVFPILSLGLTGLFAMERRPRPIVAVNALVTLFALIGFFISILAPGNAVRQAGFETVSPVTAIVRSFASAAKTLGQALDLKGVGALILCVPVFLHAVSKTDYTFKWPLPVFLGSFCLLSALYTPPIYAMGNAGMEPRLPNLFWLATVFFLFGNAFYLAGWACRRMKTFDAPHAGRLLIAAFAAGGLLFSAAVLLQLRDTNAYRAYADLKSPALAVYVQERAQRRAVYEDKTLPEPRFVPLSEPPESFLAARAVTWASDLIINDVPTAMSLYRGRGGEATYVELRYALDFFAAPYALYPGDFSVAFSFGGGDYVPLRGLCDLLGFSIEYIADRDTIRIQMGG